MYLIVGKETRLNIRIKPNVKRELDVVADYHGLTTSSYVHSVLVRQLRKEKEQMPEVFAQLEKEMMAELRSARTARVKNLGSMSDEEAKKKKAA